MTLSLDEDQPLLSKKLRSLLPRSVAVYIREKKPSFKVVEELEDIPIIALSHIWLIQKLMTMAMADSPGVSKPL